MAKPVGATTPPYHRPSGNQAVRGKPEAVRLFAMLHPNGFSVYSCQLA